jgi:hypothetical protein
MEVSAILRESAATHKSLLVIQMAVTEHMQLITQKYYSHLSADQMKEYQCGCAYITSSLFIWCLLLMYSIPLSAINRNPFCLSLLFCFTASTVLGFFPFFIFLFLSLWDSLSELIKNVCGQMVE